MTRPPPLEAEPVAPGDFSVGAPQTVPPHRANYGDPPRVTHPPGPGASQAPAGPQAARGAPAQAPTLDYSSRGAEVWEFWTGQWWRRRRNLMSAGLALIGLGVGLAMSYWVIPGLLMAAGGFLVGQALPIHKE